MTSPHTLPPDFDAWLADHPDMHPADLEQPWRLAEGADPLDAAPAPDPARIQLIQAALEQAALSNPNSRPALRLIKSSRLSLWMGIAASVALLLAVGWWGWWQLPITHTAPDGAVAQVELPDGSTIDLHPRSSLTYTRSFGTSTRYVQLDGEAFFDVTRSETPFVIETFNASVTVLGTSFNVRSWPHSGAEETVVVVETGVVKVATLADPDEAVVLEAGESTTLAQTNEVPTRPSPARLDETTAWRNGRFVFFDRTYGVAFDEAELRFGIEISAPDAIRALPLTYSRTVDDAEVLIGELCKSVVSRGIDLRYRATANGFEIYEE